MTETIKKGTQDWWMWVAMLEDAAHQRKVQHQEPSTPVTLCVQRMNRWLASVRRNPFKSLYYELFFGDMHPADRDVLGAEIVLSEKDEKDEKDKTA